MSKKKRDKYLKEYYAFHNLYRSGGDKIKGITSEKARNLRNKAMKKYFDLLPKLLISRCPICNEPMLSQFDPWGFDGFWWQERESGLSEQPSECKHFRVLTGAANLRGSSPKGVKEEAHIGPDAPYVIPAVLKLQSMIAVISSIEMADNIISYPISYFSTKIPTPGKLTAPWRRTSYSFKTRDGKNAWTIKNDFWDFNLAPWISKRKVRWIMPGDSNMQISKNLIQNCPYIDIPGNKRPQTICENKLHLGTLPNPNNDPDPFST